MLPPLLTGSVVQALSHRCVDDQGPATLPPRPGPGAFPGTRWLRRGLCARLETSGSDQRGPVAGLLGAVLAREALLGVRHPVVLVRRQVVDPVVAAVALDRGPLGTGVGRDRPV